MQLLQTLVRRSPLYDSPVYYGVNAFRRWITRTESIARWHAKGRPPPPPHAIKQRIVREYAATYGLRTLVETGTCAGEMVFAMRNTFEQIYSIELEPSLCELARRRLRRYRNVTIIQGDSTDVLPSILTRLRGPALFWLDGHFSGGFTAKGKFATPVRAELRSILTDGAHDHVVLVDDAHCFTGSDDYPTLDEVESLAKSFRPDRAVSMAENVIRIVPSA